MTAQTLFLTLREAAAKLRKSERWLWDWLDKNPRDGFGRPYCRRLGRTPLFNEEGLLRLQRAIETLDRRATFVYFIEMEGHIKIGIAANWQKRISSLQSASPFPITRLLIINAFVGLEGQLHEKFAASHVRGEWFRDCPEIRAFIAKVGRSRTLTVECEPMQAQANVTVLARHVGKVV